MKNAFYIILLLFLSISCQEDIPSGITQDKVKIVRVSATSAQDYQPNEVMIAINPADPNHLIAAANRKYLFTSTDGGHTWWQQEMSSSHGVLCDPCLDFDNAGNAYYAHLSHAPDVQLADRMVVQRQSYKTSYWNDGTGFCQNGKQHDREWICVDRSGTGSDGNIYVTWTQVDSFFDTSEDCESVILCASSNDGGESFNSPVIVSDIPGDCSDLDGTVQGAKGAIGPNGELYVCWSSGENAIYFDKSLDNGQNFGNDILITEQAGGWAQDNIPGVYRNDGCPSLVCNLTESSTRGTLYVVWSDLRNGEDDTDIFISKSTDQGSTWSAAVRVNNDNSQRHQFIPAFTIDQSTGYLYVVYYDRSETEGNRTDVILARSTDGGESFQMIKLNTYSFDPEGMFLGDYIGITAMNGKVYPVWTTVEEGQTHILVAHVEAHHWAD